MTRRPPRWQLDVRRLAALDLAWHGSRLIVAEFAIGILGPVALGLLSLRYVLVQHPPLLSWPVLLAIELFGIGANYVPLLAEALRIRKDTSYLERIKAGIQSDPAEARSYGVRQLWLLVPGSLVLFALRRSERV